MELLIKRHTGFDHGPVNIDPLGKAYLVVAALWTCTLAFGIGCVLYYRDLDFIRIRNITLMISSLLMIHVYLVLVLLNYPLNGAFPCPLGYWIISVHFPIGMALFQAQNVQLLSLSVLQRRLVAQSSKSLDRPARPNHVFPGLWAKWAGLSLLSRTYVCIAVGVVVQVRQRKGTGLISLRLTITFEAMCGVFRILYVSEIPPVRTFFENG